MFKKVYKQLISWLIQKIRVLCTNEIKDLEVFITPYKENIKDLKILVSNLAMFYYLKNKQSYLGVTSKNQYILIHEHPQAKIQIPIYSSEIIRLLKNIYQIKEEKLTSYPAISLDTISKTIIKELLNDASYQS